MTTPILYVFAISHYCEKARWTLDYLGVNYTLRHLAPGAHRRFANKLGTPASTLPILVLGDEDGDKFIQGSSAIINWAEINKSASSPSLTPKTDWQEALEIEQRLDDVLGVHIRRYYYSEALMDYPAMVRPIFTKDLPLIQKWVITAAWGAIRKLMIQGMDLGREQGLESRRLVEAELNWLDELLAHDRPFLSGDTLSRTDITAASLLAPLVQPDRHPTYAAIKLPPMLAVVCKDWQERRCMQWTREIYQNYR